MLDWNTVGANMRLRGGPPATWSSDVKLLTIYSYEGTALAVIQRHCYDISETSERIVLPVHSFDDAVIEEAKEGIVARHGYQTSLHSTSASVPPNTAHIANLFPLHGWRTYSS